MKSGEVQKINLLKKQLRMLNKNISDDSSISERLINSRDIHRKAIEKLALKGGD